MVLLGEALAIAGAFFVVIRQQDRRVMAQEFSKAFYKSDVWKDVRLSILKRDRYICQAAGCHNPAEEVHHKIRLTPENINDPNVTVNPKNLISLCGDCHKTIHKSDRASGRRNNRKESGNKILPDVVFDENGYPIPV